MGWPKGPQRMRMAVALMAAALAIALVPAVRIPTTSGEFRATISTSSDRTASASAFTCSDTFASAGLNDQAYFEYTLTAAASASTAKDAGAAGNDGTYQGAHLVDSASPIACPSTTGSAWQLNGTDSYMSTATPVASTPTAFSLVLWFKATAPADSSKRGGYLLGLSGGQTDPNGGFDRHLYIDSQGLLEFGVYDGGTHVLGSKASVDDGVWHQAVGTLSPTSGMALYVDGVLAASNTSWTAGESSAGRYWRLGSRSLSGWTNAPSNVFFAGSMRFAAAYKVALDASEVAAEYRNGKPK